MLLTDMTQTGNAPPTVLPSPKEGSNSPLVRVSVVPLGRITVQISSPAFVAEIASYDPYRVGAAATSDFYLSAD